MVVKMAEMKAVQMVVMKVVMMVEKLA